MRIHLEGITIDSRDRNNIQTLSFEEPFKAMNPSIYCSMNTTTK